jgi:tetratricopeptide (TPR) repeat protein
MYQSQITSVLEMGRTLHKQKKYQEALNLYDGAIQFHPGNAFAYAEKGDLLYALHHYSDALMAYTQAMALDLNYRGIFAHKEAPLITQGEAFYEHGDYQQALAIYEQVLQFNPDNKDAQTAKLKVLHKLEQMAEEKRIAENMQRLVTNNSSWLCKEPFRYD